MEILTLSVIAVLTQWVWPIFLFLFGLGAVVFVHELGHFLVAKAVGIKVERFAIGFGPRVCGYRGKETDYSIMLLPLGGYVKMLGQEDFAPLKEGEEPDPRAYSSKSVGARFAVISAGVVMNVIFSAIMFMIIGMIGMPVQAPVVGGTVPDSPASTEKITWLDDSGKPLDAKDPACPTDQAETLQPGDRIETIDGDGMLMSILGRDVKRFRRVWIQAVLSDVTEKYTLTIERRAIDGKVLRGRVTLGLQMSITPGGLGSKMPSFGIMPAKSTTLVRGDAYVSDDDGAFKNEDRIVAIDGQKIEHNWDIEKIEKTLRGHPVRITVERTVDGKTSQVDLSIQPMIRSTKVFYLKDGEILRGKVAGLDDKSKILTLQMTEDGVQTERKVSLRNLVNTSKDSNNDNILAKELLDVLGMIPRLRVGAVGDGSPADEAGIKTGDVVVRYGHHTAPTHLKLKELNRKFLADGADIVVMRDGKVLPPRKIQPETHGENALIGIVVSTDMEHLVVAGVRENSPADDLEIITGDVIEKVNGQDVGTWYDLLTALGKLQGKDVKLMVRRGDNRSEKTVPSLNRLIFDESDYTSSIPSEPWQYTRLMDPKVSRGAMAALAWGGRETTFFITINYATIRSMFNRTVSPKALSGPLGIG